MSDIKLEEVHPAWPEHADMHCPLCGHGLVDKEPQTDMEYGYFIMQDGTDTFARDCPHCHQPILVTRKVTIKVEYKAEKP